MRRKAVSCGFSGHAKFRHVWAIIGRLYLDMAVCWSRPLGVHVGGGVVRFFWAGACHAPGVRQWRLYCGIIGLGAAWFAREAVRGQG